VLFCRRVSFDIKFNCLDPIDKFDEGIEFAARVCSSPSDWIPIKFIYTNTKKKEGILIGESEGTTLHIRGYSVEKVLSDSESKASVQVNICISALTESIQFRWLQTSFLQSNSIRDVWALDNIEICLESDVKMTRVLYHDNFDDGVLK